MDQVGMDQAEIVNRRPRVAGVACRILFLTFIATLLGFAVGLLVGIAGTVIGSALHGRHPDMTNAYRHIAVPFAVAVAVVSLSGITVHEVRHYRRRLALWRGF
jgi:uncharacterized BrkB/YihY/UPF0761 family membrane protein